MTATYRLLTGSELDLGTLNEIERDFLKTILEQYSKNPEWSEFSDGWMRLWSETRLTRESKTIRICQDLEARIGIVQKRADLPDFKDTLQELLSSEKKTVEEALHAIGTSKKDLLFALRDHKAQIEPLSKFLRKLGFRLIIQSDEEIVERCKPSDAQAQLAAFLK